TSRLVGGQTEFADTAARAATEQANVVGDLHQRYSEMFGGTRGRNDRVMRGETREFVGSRPEGIAREVSNLLCDFDRVIRVRVESRADGAAAQSQLVKTVERLAQSLVR